MKKETNEGVALLHDPDLSEVNTDINDHAKSVNKLVLDIVNKITGQLDEVVAEIRERLINEVETVATELLEIYALRISTELYYMGQSQEYLGLRADVSKAVYKEQFNYHYQRTDGTINDKTAYSEAHSMTEYLAMSVSERAYKRLKIKIENAYELLGTIKKILSRRIAEFELTKMQGSEVPLQRGIDKREEKPRFNVVGRRQ